MAYGVSRKKPVVKQKRAKWAKLKTLPLECGRGEPDHRAERMPLPLAEFP